MRPLHFYDISILLGEENASYPGDLPYSREQVCSLDGGDAYSLSALHLSAHSGTHIDAPAHFIKNGKTIDQYPIERFIVPATVIAAEGLQSVGPEVLEGRKVEKGGAVLFRTDNSKSGLSRSGIFSDDYVCISREAALECVRMGAGIVGIDYLSVDRHNDDGVHMTLLGADVLVIEILDLCGVPEGEYTLICLPLNVKRGEAAPTRAVLVG